MGSSGISIWVWQFNARVYHPCQDVYIRSSSSTHPTTSYFWPTDRTFHAKIGTGRNLAFLFHSIQNRYDTFLLAETYTLQLSYHSLPLSKIAWEAKRVFEGALPADEVGIQILNRHYHAYLFHFQILGVVRRNSTYPVSLQTFSPITNSSWKLVFLSLGRDRYLLEFRIQTINGGPSEFPR